MRAKIIVIYLFVTISWVTINAQKLSKFELDSILSGLPILKRAVVFNDVTDSKNISFRQYSQLISNYDNIDSVYVFDKENRKYLGAWSGYIVGDTTIVNIDNTDEYGKEIIGAPTKIIYHNKISLLGTIDVGQKETILLVKVETYNYFVIHLFSFSNKGRLISVVPVGKIEKDVSQRKEDWVVIQKGLINKDNSIFASYIAEAYVELTYVIKNGHFKVIQKKIEE